MFALESACILTQYDVLVIHTLCPDVSVGNLPGVASSGASAGALAGASTVAAAAAAPSALVKSTATLAFQKYICAATAAGIAETVTVRRAASG